MSQLYERISHGDRKTIVRKYEKGQVLSIMTTPPQTIVLKTDVVVEVTQEYNAYTQTWRDVRIYLDNMVETIEVSDQMPRPEPMRIPGAGEPRQPLPHAEVRRPWWRFW